MRRVKTAEEPGIIKWPICFLRPPTAASGIGRVSNFDFQEQGKGCAGANTAFDDRLSAQIVSISTACAASCAFADVASEARPAALLFADFSRKDLSLQASAKEGPAPSPLGMTVKPSESMLNVSRGAQAHPTLLLLVTAFESGSQVCVPGVCSRPFAEWKS